MTRIDQKPEVNQIVWAVVLMVITLAANFTWSAVTGLPAVSRDVEQLQHQVESLEVQIDMLTKCASSLDTRVSVDERDIEWIKKKIEERSGE